MNGTTGALPQRIPSKPPSSKKTQAASPLQAGGLILKEASSKSVLLKPMLHGHAAEFLQTFKEKIVGESPRAEGSVRNIRPVGSPASPGAGPLASINPYQKTQLGNVGRVPNPDFKLPDVSKQLVSDFHRSLSQSSNISDSKIEEEEDEKEDKLGEQDTGVTTASEMSGMDGGAIDVGGGLDVSAGGGDLGVGIDASVSGGEASGVDVNAGSNVSDSGSMLGGAFGAVGAGVTFGIATQKMTKLLRIQSVHADKKVLSQTVRGLNSTIEKTALSKLEACGMVIASKKESAQPTLTKAINVDILKKQINDLKFTGGNSPIEKQLEAIVAGRKEALLLKLDTKEGSQSMTRDLAKCAIEVAVLAGIEEVKDDSSNPIIKTLLTKDRIKMNKLIDAMVDNAMAESNFVVEDLNELEIDLLKQAGILNPEERVVGQMGKQLLKETIGELLKKVDSEVIDASYNDGIIPKDMVDSLLSKVGLCSDKDLNIINSSGVADKPIFSLENAEIEAELKKVGVLTTKSQVQKGVPEHKMREAFIKLALKDVEADLKNIAELSPDNVKVVKKEMGKIFLNSKLWVSNKPQKIINQSVKDLLTNLKILNLDMAKVNEKLTGFIGNFDRFQSKLSVVSLKSELKTMYQGMSAGEGLNVGVETLQVGGYSAISGTNTYNFGRFMGGMEGLDVLSSVGMGATVATTAIGMVQTGVKLYEVSGEAKQLRAETPFLKLQKKIDARQYKSKSKEEGGLYEKRNKLTKKLEAKLKTYQTLRKDILSSKISVSRELVQKTLGLDEKIASERDGKPNLVKSRSVSRSSIDKKDKKKIDKLNKKLNEYHKKLNMLSQKLYAIQNFKEDADAVKEKKSGIEKLRQQMFSIDFDEKIVSKKDEHARLTKLSEKYKTIISKIKQKLTKISTKYSDDVSRKEIADENAVQKEELQKDLAKFDEHVRNNQYNLMTDIVKEELKVVKLLPLKLKSTLSLLKLYKQELQLKSLTAQKKELYIKELASLGVIIGVTASGGGLAPIVVLAGSTIANVGASSILGQQSKQIDEFTEGDLSVAINHLESATIKYTQNALEMERELTAKKNEFENRSEIDAQARDKSPFEVSDSAKKYLTIQHDLRMMRDLLSRSKELSVINPNAQESKIAPIGIGRSSSFL